MLPFLLGLQHAVEPDHVAVVTGLALRGSAEGRDRRGAWRLGCLFGLSHMAAVAVLALLAGLLGDRVFGDAFERRMDQAAWVLILAMGLWNLAAALGLRAAALHSHPHRHGGLVHEHPHGKGLGHRFHHGALWLGAFFGLGGLRTFTALLHQGLWSGKLAFLGSLALFGLGLTTMFTALAALAGLLMRRGQRLPGFRRALYAVSGCGNVALALYLLSRG